MDAETILIAFPDFETARKAIERLENQGLEGATMEFEEHDRLAADASSSASDQDGRMMGRTFRNLTVAGIAGALIGVVLGTLAGMAMFPDGPAAGVAAMALGVGAAGAGVGIVVGGIARHKQSEAWADTFEAPDMAARLRVTVSSAEEHDLVVSVAEEVGGQVQVPGG